MTLREHIENLKKIKTKREDKHLDVKDITKKIDFMELNCINNIHDWTPTIGISLSGNSSDEYYTCRYCQKEK